ncbi:MAG: S8/S53 family peptidase [Bacteroidota bacterium]
MKKLSLALVMSLITVAGFGQQLDQLIDYSRVIVKFETGIEQQTQRDMLKSVKGLSDHLVFLQAPELVIAYTSFDTSQPNILLKFKAVFDNLVYTEGVSYVGPYLKNAEGTEFGILDKIFVKPENPDKNHFWIEWFFQRGLKVPTVKASNTFDGVWEVSGIRSGLELFQLAVSLNQEEWTVFAEPNYLLQPLVHTNDPLLSQQWAIDNLGTPQQGNGTPGADMEIRLAWQITTGDPSIKVAVMDSGVDTIHWDLVDNLLPGYDAFGQGTNGFPTPNFPQDGHGTACAGIIAAKGDNGQGVAGVAYDASIIPVRMFFYADTSLMGVPLGVIPVSTSEVLADGTQWAWQNGADIQSHSWSLPDLFLTAGILPGDPALVEMAIADAASMGRGGKGSLLFFSSGNEGDPPNWPGRLPDAMTVNATSMCDEAKTPSSCDGQDWTGNWGAELDFGAPGVRVYTVDMMGGSGYNGGIWNCCFNGTSAACPNVSGVAALLLSYDPDLTLSESREILSRSCEKVGGYAYDSLAVYGSWTPELGYGRINAYQALLEAGADPVSIDEPLSENGLAIFPNPASEKVLLRWHGIQEIKQVRIYNAVGAVVHSANFSTELNISHLSNGIWVIEAELDDGSSVVKKLVIAR